MSYEDIVEEIIVLIEKKKNAEFASWQDANYKFGYRDGLENLKLDLFELINQWKNQDKVDEIDPRRCPDDL